MLIFFLKEHTVITNTVCLLFSPKRTFYSFEGFEAFLQRSVLVLSSCKVKGDTNETKDRHQKSLMTIILGKKRTHIALHLQYCTFFSLANTITIFEAGSNTCCFHCCHVACKTWVILMNKTFDLNLGNAYDHTKKSISSSSVSWRTNATSG